MDNDEDKKESKIWQAIKCPYTVFKIFWDVTSDTDLINYDPCTIAEIDHRHKTIGGSILNFVLDWLPYIVGLVVIYQILVPEIQMIGKEKN
jgi:hypothetical protein